LLAFSREDEVSSACTAGLHIVTRAAPHDIAEARRSSIISPSEPPSSQSGALSNAATKQVLPSVMRAQALI
jgi:hypothetical protein